MRFSVFTASLPELTPAQAAKTLAATGYDGVEWRVTDQQPSADGRPGFWAGNLCTWPFATFLDDAPRIRQVTEDAGLAQSAVGAYVSCLDTVACDRALAGTAAVGATQVRIGVPRYDGSEPYGVLADRLRVAWREVAALARRHGVRALLELHHGTPVASPSAAVSLLDGIDPEHVGVVHDAGNMVCEGWESSRMGLEILGDRLAHVHVKNAAWERTGTRDDGSAVWETAWVPLRDGVVDLRALFDALAAVGYDGWVALEDFSRLGDPEERLADNLAVVRAAAGLA